MPTYPNRIVVIGAGPVGLCLSLALAQAGLQVCLVEALGDDNFLEQVPRAGTARRGIYMSDGVMNVALLKTEGNEKPGLYHFGMWVDDLDEAEKKVTQAGGTYLAGRPTSPNSFYEAKFRDPDGVVFDLTHHGWAGATKEVTAKA